MFTTCDLLERLAKESDNDLDDKAVEFIKRGLFPPKVVISE